VAGVVADTEGEVLVVTGVLVLATPEGLVLGDVLAAGAVAVAVTVRVAVDALGTGAGADDDGGRDVGAVLDGAALDRAALDGAALDGAALDGAALDGAALEGAVALLAEKVWTGASDGTALELRTIGCGLRVGLGATGDSTAVGAVTVAGAGAGLECRDSKTPSSPTAAASSTLAAASSPRSRRCVPDSGAGSGAHPVAHSADDPVAGIW